MNSWRNFVDKVKRDYPLEPQEKRGLIITIVVLGFIFSFRQWGIDKFDPMMGFKNLLIAIILVTVSLLLRECAHRTMAAWLGYKTHYKAWILGLVIGLVLAFLSNGHLLFIAPGILLVTHLEIHRLGKAHYALSMKHLGWIAMSGPIINMLFAAIMKSLYLGTSYPIFQTLMVMNIWIAIFDMIPVPPFNGSQTFFGSRYVYMFVLGAILGCAALLFYLSGILPIIGALILGAIVFFVFFVYVDKRW